MPWPLSPSAASPLPGSHAPVNRLTCRRRERDGLHVHFGQVHIREMSREAGGGSAVSSDGVPLGLGWKIIDEKCLDVEDFEKDRSQSRSPMSVYQLNGHIPNEQREKYLLDAGVHWTELVRCFEATDFIRQEREDSYRAFEEEHRYDETTDDSESDSTYECGEQC